MGDPTTNNDAAAKITESNRLTQSELKGLGQGILDAFDRYCKENNLTYWLSYGTLLGAARHQGYIPWDDDIDLMMPLEDYRKFIELYQKDIILPAPFRLASASAGGVDHHIWFPKIYDTRTVCHQNYLEDTIGTEQGAWIDILPIVGAADSAQREGTMGKFKQLMDDIEQCTFKPESCEGFLRGLKRDLVRASKRRHGHRALLLEYENLMLEQHDLAGSPLCYDPSYPHVEYLTSWFADTIEMEFEGKKYPAPRAFDEILTACYGAWRELPPEDERIPHVCEVTWLISPADRPSIAQ